MPATKIPLTPKQEAFVREYLVDLNSSAAAIRAGYSESSAGYIGWENLRKPHIQAALQEAMDARARRTQVDADRVLLELVRIGFSRMDDFVEWGPSGVKLKTSASLSEDQARAVLEVSETVTQHGGTIRFKLHDKTRALELIAKHLGMLTERVDIGGSVEVNVADVRDRISRRLAGIATRHGAGFNPGGNGGNGARRT